MDPGEEARGEVEREAPVRTPARTLVTGATGCLGRHLVDALVERRTSVRALARESSRIDQLEDLGVEIQRGSLVDEEDLERAVAGVDTVFHLGGLVHDDPNDTSDELWQQLHSVNVEGSERLARLAAAAGATRFVFASSLRVSGFGNQILWPEDGARTNGDLYARSKGLAEDALLAVGRDTGLKVVCIRPRFIYGNHDRYVLPRLVQSVQRGVVPVASNETICDIVYVGDCVQALLLAAERPVGGCSYNITSGECLSFREILTEVGRALGTTPRFLPMPPSVLVGAATGAELVARALGRRPGLSRARVRWLMNDHHFSIAKARDELGYQPRYPLRDGLAEVDLRQFVSNGRI
jgi:nucleoside-diphosphate-sugar epimerase